MIACALTVLDQARRIERPLDPAVLALILNAGKRVTFTGDIFSKLAMKEHDHAIATRPPAYA